MIFLYFAALADAPPPDPLDEAEVIALVDAARAGNVRASDRLYRQHVARVHRLSRSLSASEADAEELTQEAFIDALTNLTRFEARPGRRFIAWLTTLVLNRARKGRRGPKVEPTDQAQLVALAGAEPAALDEVTLARRRALLAALATLGDRDRSVVALFYGAELTAEEVATSVGLSAANVRKVCERQRKHLLELLGEPHE